MPITTVVFDAYGTLFDVAAAARIAAAEPEHAQLAEIWPALAEHWRLKQLQYTWLRSMTGDYADFWRVTQDALDWALERCDLAHDAALRARLLTLYHELQAYPEVPAMLTALHGAGLKVAILSNGTPKMLEGAVSSAGITPLLDAVLSVETMGIFKPDARIYQMVPDHFGCTREEVLFVSSNGWDVAGAAGFGFRTVWVNRAGDPVDRLPHRPAQVMQDLSTLPADIGL